MVCDPCTGHRPRHGEHGKRELIGQQLDLDRCEATLLVRPTNIRSWAKLVRHRPRLSCRPSGRHWRGVQTRTYTSESRTQRPHNDRIPRVRGGLHEARRRRRTTRSRVCGGGLHPHRAHARRLRQRTGEESAIRCRFCGATMRDTQRPNRREGLRALFGMFGRPWDIRAQGLRNHGEEESTWSIRRHIK